MKNSWTNKKSIALSHNITGWIWTIRALDGCIELISMWMRHKRSRVSPQLQLLQQETTDYGPNLFICHSHVFLCAKTFIWSGSCLMKPSFLRKRDVWPGWGSVVLWVTHVLAMCGRHSAAVHEAPPVLPTGSHYFLSVRWHYWVTPDESL